MNKRTMASPLARKAVMFGAVVLLFILLMTFASLRIKVSDLSAQNEALDKEISSKTTVNTELRDALDEGATDEAVAKIARDVLNMASPGEKVYIDSSEQ